MRFLTGAGICVPIVLHSGKKRTGQTAELLAGGIGAGVSLGKTSGIDPLDLVSPFAQVVNR